MRSSLGANLPSSAYWVSGYPDLVAEWHPVRNDGLRPEDVTYGSSARIWWKCAAGVDHEWVASPNSRASLGNGCPYCAGRRVSTTTNLTARFPSLAYEWHPTRNGALTADPVVTGATRLAWWMCAADPEHVWSRTPRERTRDHSGCPFCANHRVSRENSLLALAPELAAQWDRVRNDSAACDVVAGSSRRPARGEWLRRAGRATEY